MPLMEERRLPVKPALENDPKQHSVPLQPAVPGHQLQSYPTMAYWQQENHTLEQNLATSQTGLDSECQH
jgi:hypothetical protein